LTELQESLSSFFH